MKKLPSGGPRGGKPSSSGGNGGPLGGNLWPIPRPLSHAQASQHNI